MYWRKKSVDEYNGNKVLYSDEPYIVIATSKELIIINTHPDAEYRNHSHMRLKRNKANEVVLTKAINLIEKIKRRHWIESNYLRVSAKRLTLDQDYLDYLTRKEHNKKQKYYNTHKRG